MSNKTSSEIASTYNSEYFDGIKNTLNIPRTYPFSINYNKELLTYYIIARIFGTQVLSKSFHVFKLADFNEWMKSTTKWLIDISIEYDNILEKQKSVAPKDPAEKTVEFISHRTGICSYQSLGSIRHAWISLSMEGIHDQWFKVYFKKDELLIDKTVDKFNSLRNNAVEERLWGDKPPSVAPINKILDNTAKQYLTKNSDIILTQLNKLPLSRTKFREDYEYSVCILRQQPNTKIIVPATDADLASPDADLWVVILVNYTASNRSYDGWAKKLGDNKTVMVSINRQSFFNNGSNYIYTRDVCKASIIKAKNSNNYYDYMYSYNLLDNVSEKDELIEYLLDDAAATFVKNMELEQVKEQPNT